MARSPLAMGLTEPEFDLFLLMDQAHASG